MRILFASRFAGFAGGVEQHVHDSASALRARGVECVAAYGVERRNVAAWKSAFEATRACGDLHEDGDGPPFVDVVRDVDPDIVYLHSVPPAIIGSTPDRRTVRMVHDHDLCCPRRHKYFSWNQKICEHAAGWRCWLDGAFLARDRSKKLGVRFESIGNKIDAMRRHWDLDALLVGSEWMRQELLVNGCPDERVHVVPPAVRMDLPSRPLSVPSDNNILYVGQLVRGKGVDYLLASLSIMPEPFKARIVGDGNARSSLEDLASHFGIGDRVTFEGWVDHDRLHEAYAWSRVAVVPSRWPEPFGMVGLEAMGHGRPVVGFDSGGIRDWLADGETGLLVPTGDAEALTLAIQRILSDDAFAERSGEAAYARATTTFGFEGLIDRLSMALGVEACMSV